MNWKTILIVALSFLMVQSSWADGKKKKKKITVSGFVMDVNEKPLEGVAIIIDDVQSNVFTNKKGFYKIKIKPDIKTIMAYSLLHGGIEMEYAGHKKINFILKYDDANANYISPEQGKILNYGYGKISSNNSTSSIGKIEEEEMENDSYSNIYEMIQGRVPGVSVSNGRIIIRGISSIMAQGDPLFVVDGVQTESIAFINPRQVKSISVLKGSAAAIYGSRGSLGVIIITLKDGSK